MGAALIKGILENKIAASCDVSVSDVSQARRAALEKEFGVRTTGDNAVAARTAEVVVLAVKPQVLGEVMSGLKGEVPPEAVVLSIVAGAKIASLKAGLGHDAIARSMPNMPAQIGLGMTVWTTTGQVKADQKASVQKVLAGVGKEIYVADEKFLDMATAVSGSGPAYFFLVMEAMIDAAVHIGFSRDAATELVVQTALGSAKVMETSGKHPAELRNMVTSPGGTTAEALLKLEEGRLRGLMMQAVIAAYEKAKKLGEVASK